MGTTDRQATEAENERLAARATQLEGAKAALEGFAAVAAHELLETLVMTEAYASLVGERLDGPWHADSRRDLDVLSRDAARVRRLVETLLDDARSGGRRPPPGRIDLAALVEESLASLEPELAERDVRVEVGPLPSVLGDQRLIGVVLTMLLNTALRHCRRGGTLRVRAARRARRWSIALHSEGAGPASEDRLTVCRYLVRRHGGQIGLGAGRLSFTLPRP